MAAAAAGVASPADKERYRGHCLFGVGSFVDSFVYMSGLTEKKTRAEQGVAVLIPVERGMMVVEIKSL